MAVINNYIRETTTTVGTGTISLAGAVSGSQGFVAGVGNGATTFYTITDGTNWEVGYGVVTSGSPNTLSRSVISSSNSNALVNFGAGSKNVSGVIPSQRQIFLNEGGTALQGVPNGSVTSAMLASSLSLTTPALGVATATSLAVNGATIGTNALAVTGTTALAGALTVSSGGAAVTGNSTVTGTLGVTGTTALGTGATMSVSVAGGTNGAVITMGSFSVLGSASPDMIRMGGSYSSTPGSNSKLRFYDDNTNSFGFGVSTTGAEYINTSSQPLDFWIGGGRQVRIAYTASASNYLTLTGSNGGAPTIGTSGGDLNLNSNSNVVAFDTGATNYLRVFGNSTGNTPNMAASGGDTNISIGLIGKGTGGITIYGNGGVNYIAIFSNSGSPTNYLTFQSAANPTIGTSGGNLAISAALVLSQTTLLQTSVSLTNGAGANTGTLTNAPAAGNPTKWIPINDNGTTRYIPAW